MQTPTFKHHSSAILAAAVLAISGSVFAAPPTSSAQDTPSEASADRPVDATAGQHKKQFRKRHHHRSHPAMKDVAMWVPGYGPVTNKVVESLGLDSKQTALLNQAQSFSAELKTQRDFHTKKPNATSQGDQLDPHGIVQSQQERMAERQQARTKATEKWLAVWDSLDTKQQDAIAAYVSKRVDQRAKHRSAKVE